MSLRINLNSAALTAHRQLAGTDSALSKSIERLSSGYKINNAGDDPAGLVISEKLRAQVGGLNQAIKNAGDAVNMVKTAEGALQEVNRLLNTMRTLAVHAANGSNDAASLDADQAQITSALASINKISSETMFGGKKLLDGSAGITTNITAAQVVAADLSKSTLTTDQTNLKITTTQAATKADLAVGTVDLTAGSLVGKYITINGVTIEGGATAAATRDNINAQSSLTGVRASLGGVGNAFLKLDQLYYGSDKAIVVTNGTDILGSASASALGADVQANVFLSDGTTDVSDATWTAGTGSILKDSLGNVIELTSAAAAAAPGAVNGGNGVMDVTVGTMTFQVGAYSGQTRTLSIGSIATTALGLANGTSVTDLSLIDVSSDAQSAIDVIAKAITDVSTLRATLGSAQKNTFESAINSLGIASENISASESTIRDTDMAAEMVEFTRNQIMQQAGTAMLAQANQAPQALLRLLQ